MSSSKKTERKVYNEIPKESSLWVNPLPSKDTVKYRLLNTFNPVTGKKTLRTWIAPDEETVIDADGEMYDIAAIRTKTADGVIDFIPIMFADDQDSSIEVRGSSINEQKIYKRLELSNYNKSNPHRDQTVTPKFERIDMDADANRQMSNRKAVRQALEIVELMSDQDIIDYLKAKNKPLSKPAINRNTMEEIAEKSPDAIIKSNISTGANDLKDELVRLKKDGIIIWNKETKKWHAFDDSTILTIKKAFGFDPMNELYQHVSNNPEALSKVKIAYSELIKAGLGDAPQGPPPPKNPLAKAPKK